ncbi:hypothetical protein ACKC9G_08510 [Pokkaliibacter sp. CJK22405]|uniref:hypothetical protein n=1 Tax=Pokkaliibacter sp. CJK22405 TaxID=3384615 RepID=UPI003984AE86
MRNDINRVGGGFNTYPTQPQEGGHRARHHPRGTLSLIPEEHGQSASMSEPAKLFSQTTPHSINAGPGQHYMLKINRRDAQNADAQRAPEAAGKRAYVGLERMNQALRWFSSVGLRSAYQAVEVQATVHSGKLYITSNQNSNELKDALARGLDKNLNFERSFRHQQEIKDFLISEKGFKAFREQALKEFDENPPAEDAANQRHQLGEILDILHDAAKALASKDPSQIDAYLEVVPNDVYPGSKAISFGKDTKVSMHAEQMLYEDIGRRKDDVLEQTRKSYGLKEDQPVLIPIAGARRPCGICDHIEQELKTNENSIFNDSTGPFRLIRSSQRPGNTFPGAQVITSAPFGGQQNIGGILDTLKNSYRAAELPKIDSFYDTDSDNGSLAGSPVLERNESAGHANRFFENQRQQNAGRTQGNGRDRSQSNSRNNNDRPVFNNPQWQERQQSWQRQGAQGRPRYSRAESDNQTSTSQPRQRPPIQNRRQSEDVNNFRRRDSFRGNDNYRGNDNSRGPNRPNDDGQPQRFRGADFNRPPTGPRHGGQRPGLQRSRSDQPQSHSADRFAPAFKRERDEEDDRARKRTRQDEGA